MKAICKTDEVRTITYTLTITLCPEDARRLRKFMGSISEGNCTPARLDGEHTQIRLITDAIYSALAEAISKAG